MVAMPLAHISWALADNAARPACDAFFIDRFGAETAYEMLVTPETEKYRFDREERLMVVGNTMLIPIAPAGRGAEIGNPLGDMLRRSAGPNRWIGLALRTADLKAADAWFRTRGFELHYDRGMENHYFLLSKRQAMGMRIEVMQGQLPGDPRLLPEWAPQRWAENHPLGIEGLLSIDLAAPSLEEARALFAGRFDWPELGERNLPGENARGVTFDVGDTVLEALVPASGEGFVDQALGATGICGITFKVRSAETAVAHLRAQGFDLVGDPGTRFAIRLDQAQDRLIWFSASVPPGWPAPRSLIREPARFPPVPDDGAGSLD